MKLFDDDVDDNNEIEKIEVNKEFAKRYEHNKKREDLQRLEEMKKKGLIESSGSESGSSESESESDDDDNDDGVKFFDALLKVKKKDPILMQKDKKLFNDDEDDGDDDGDDDEKRVKKERKMYLKDVMAQHLIEEGPQFGENDEGGVKSVKSYAQEQDELRKEVLEAIAKAEEGGEGDGDDELLREKERGEDDDDDEEVVDEEMSKKLDEYFGDDEKLNENERFLKSFFAKKMWVDKEKGKKIEVDEDELAWLSEDEEALDRQDDLEREIVFRHEENVGDRVMGFSRVVAGSVRKESNARKGQRERKKERMAQAEVERQEEVKRLKNLKKKEIQERLEKIREIAGVDRVVGGGGIGLTEEDLEEDFDPDEFDKKMREAFGEEYYQAEDVDPGFGSGDDGESDLEKPDFDKEDELLGLPKDWDVIKSNGGFLAEREKWLKNEGDETDNEADENDEIEREEGKKRKRKRKMSLKEKVVLDKELDELYKLDYEDAIGDLKTRFKYRQVAPRKYGLTAAEILAMDEKDLNQYVSLKKLAPYREKEWKVHPMQRQSFMKKKGLLLEGLAKGQMGRKKRRRMEGDDVGESSKMSNDVKAQGNEVGNDESQLSRKAKRRRRQKEKKLPESRLVAYGKIPSTSKSKSKN